MVFLHITQIFKEVIAMCVCHFYLLMQKVLFLSAFFFFFIIFVTKFTIN